MAEGAGPQLQPPKELRHASSNKSLRSKLSIILPSRDTPSSPAPQQQQQQQPSTRHERTLSAPDAPAASDDPLVESPTGIASLSQDIPSITRTLPPSSTTPSFGQSLHVPDNSDAASVHSVSSTSGKKRTGGRPWRRPSNPAPAVPAVPRSATTSNGAAPNGRSPPRKNTAAGGLASALAASGLAMANPAMSLPPTLAPSESAGRTSVDRPGARSRGASFTNGTSDFSDGGSFHSGSDEDEDDSDELDLDPEDIPVTGFAVASNKRNQDFHELFPSVPEGDYLIEGV